jgi:membrane protein implicated in regulation of membrane protease activity
MFAVPDAFAAFYLICFLVGLVFVLVSAALGLAHDVTHIPGLSHGHVGGAGAHVGHALGADGAHAAGHVGHAGAGAGHAGHASGEGRGVSSIPASPFNLMTVMAFLTWFGGAGYILHAVYGVFLPLTLIGAVAAGLLAGWLVFMFLVRVLLPGTAGPDPRDYEVVGNLGHVSIGIEPDGIGEVVYTLGGARHSDGARSLDGLPIPHGTEVVIVRYERGIAYVEPWDRYLEGEKPGGQTG